MSQEEKTQKSRTKSNIIFLLMSQAESLKPIYLPEPKAKK